MIDYRELLVKYMTIVGMQNGVDFVPETVDEYPVELTEQELEELKTISDGVR